MSGEAGLDGLIDVVINPGMLQTKTYVDVLLDNVDPDNHVYPLQPGNQHGSYLTYGYVDVPKSYIIDGQLKVRVVRHPDTNSAPAAPVCTEQPIDMTTTPPTVPTQVYQNDDAHTVHLYVWCQDGSGGKTVTSDHGWGYVSITSDMELLQNEWPMFHNTLMRTGHSGSIAPNINNTIWSYTTGGNVHSSPAIISDRVYVGSRDNKTYCLNATTGAFIWSYATGGYVDSSPAVAYGRVYVGSLDNKTYCLNATTGAHIWNCTTSRVYSSPAVAYGRVYVGSFSFYCLNATTGAFIWSYATGGSARSSPAIADGKVYIGSTDENVYCLNATTGAYIWSYATGGIIWNSSPAIADGRVYVGSVDFSFYCLNATTGTHIWNYTTGLFVSSSPAVAYGRIYVGSDDKSFYCLNATTGAFIWSYATGGYVDSSPAVAEGKVYIGSTDENVYCLNATTGAFIWSFTTGGSVYSSPAVADGRVYVGSNDNKTYAFEDPTYTLTVTSTSGGTTNPSLGTHRYRGGTTVAVTAFPQDYHVFHHWELDASLNYSNPLELTMGSNHTLHAVFTYNITVNAHCATQDADLAVSIDMDGSPTGYSTPYTFVDLTGTHNFTVPNVDLHGHPFRQWSTGETSTTITANGMSTCTAYYQAKYNLTIITDVNGTTNPPPGTYLYWDRTQVMVMAMPYSDNAFDFWTISPTPSKWTFDPTANPTVVIMDKNYTLNATFKYTPPPYNVTIAAYCNTSDADLAVSIDMDGSPTGYSTPYTFVDLTGTHNFTVPNVDLHGHPFRQWSTGETSTTITPSTNGTYTAYYGIIDVAVLNVTPAKTIVGKGYTVSINVTVQNQGSRTERFFTTAPYFGDETIPTPDQCRTFWSTGDANLDGRINQEDADVIMENYYWVGSPDQNPADLNSDGLVNIVDWHICLLGLGLDIWTYFGLPLPRNVTQRGVMLVPGSQITLTFVWNTTDVDKGNYTMTVIIPPILNEADTADNTYSDGNVLITIPGDVTGDILADMLDIDILIGKFLADPADPKWNPNCDVNGDGIIDMADIDIAIVNFLIEDP
jgi:outer membrane protein assembly factor BamB